LTYPWGVTGGHPGRRSRKTLNRKNGSVELLPSKCDRIKVNEGDLLYFDTWGGGGWGDPLKRATDKVAFDVEAGLVTRKGARRYGVVLKENLSVDASKTKTLRASMAKKRGRTKLFDFGGTIEELRKRCKKETGMEPPVQPKFRTRLEPGSATGKKKPAKKASRKTKAAQGTKKKAGRKKAA
jgi:N-methylhydantoinase B